MTARLLLCTDMDRTLVPNGSQPESARARPLFSRLAARKEVCLAYVTGRHLGLAEEGMARFSLPMPDFILGDVGTRIYHSRQGGWVPDRSWEEHIDPDFNGLSHADLAGMFSDLDALQAQEGRKQGPHKLSYYLDPGIDPQDLIQTMETRLGDAGVRASLIWSIDDLTGNGLLDVVPASATKLGAIRWLMDELEFTEADTVFAGDSGNDLEVLCSTINGVLVANATEDVRREALQRSRQGGTAAALYFARGGYRGLNGNYSAGILEGLVHYKPEVDSWI